MPLYMDTHRNVDGLTTEAVIGAHQADLATQEKYGVDYKQYWYNEAEGAVYCLVEARTLRLLLRCTARRTAWWPTTSLRFTRVTEASELVP